MIFCTVIFLCFNDLNNPQQTSIRLLQQDLDVMDKKLAFFRFLALWCLFLMVFFLLSDRQKSLDSDTDNKLQDMTELLQVSTDGPHHTTPASVNNGLLFYNKVPKPGSSMMCNLLKLLKDKNHFNFSHPIVFGIRHAMLGMKEERKMVQEISNLTRPSVFVRHTFFLNFSRFDHDFPVYLNMVRDPVERVISWFYYMRLPSRQGFRKKKHPDMPFGDRTWMRKDFESCILSGDPECQFIKGKDFLDDSFPQQTLFFCGQSEDCRDFNGDYPLRIAKQNVEMYYPVVGVLEEWNRTLAVLEEVLPLFFTGASRTFYNAKQMDKNENIHPKVSELIRNTLSKNFTNEIDFYQFCRQRLYNQYKKLHSQ